MRRHPLTLAILCLGIMATVLATPPAALAQTVKSDYDKKTDFSKYKSFAFREGTAAPTPFAQERIEAAITTEMKKRGASPAETADMLVFTHTQVSKDKRMDVTSFGYGGYPGWGGWGGGFGSSSVMVTEVPVGTVVVDVVDAASNALIWRGVASDTLASNPTPEKSEKRINKAIAKLFSKYPVAPTGK